MADRERPLNKRGKRNAPEMGRRLNRRGVTLDRILTSPAVRAARTAEIIAEVIGYPPEDIEMRSQMYEASPMLLLELVRRLPESYMTVALFGHNPETTIFANLLGGLRIANVPTCGIVALEFAVDSWSAIAEGTGKLLYFDYPKRDPS